MIENLKQLAQMCHSEKCSRYPKTPPAYIPTTKYTDKTANGLTKAIKRAIELMGGQAERVNTMGVWKKGQQFTDIMGRKYTGGGGYIPGGGTKGSADIHAVIKGKSIKIEVKIGADKQSEAQKEYQQSIERAGGAYIIARSFEQCMSELKSVMNK